MLRELNKLVEKRIKEGKKVLYITQEWSLDSVSKTMKEVLKGTSYENNLRIEEGKSLRDIRNKVETGNNEDVIFIDIYWLMDLHNVNYEQIDWLSDVNRKLSVTDLTYNGVLYGIEIYNMK